MATGTIKNVEPKLFTLTGNTALSSSKGYGIYFPDGKVVLIIGEASNGSDINTSITLATIPSEYRPSSQRGGVAYMSGVSGNPYGTHYLAVESDGRIRQGASSVARSVFYAAFYTLP